MVKKENISKIVDFFKSRERNTNYKKEFTAGITTFMTMAYILVVQPGAIVGYGNAAFIIDTSGVMITKRTIIVTCVIISGPITLLMALYTNLPFALTTGMGSNLIFGALIQNQQLPLSGAVAMTLISGVIPLLLTTLDIRDLIVKAVPKNTKISIGTVIDFFIAYLGLKNTGTVALTGSGMGMGNFTDPAVMLTILGLVIIVILAAYKVNGAILISIVIVTFLGIPTGVTTVPSTFAKVPGFTGLGNVMSNLDFKSVLSFPSVVPIFMAFCGDFFSTPGTIFGASAKTGMLGENGDLLDIQQPLLVDVIGICVGAPTGNTIITTFMKPSAGVEADGRTGFTSVAISVIFMIMVFLSPLVLVIPNATTGPVLISVGFLVISGFKDIGLADFIESFEPLVMIMSTVFTGSIVSGISVGTLAFVLIKAAAGKFRRAHPITYITAILLICYFIYG